MMYPDTQIHILSEDKKELYSGTVQDLNENFMENEIKHVWGQADLGGMRITIKK